MRKDLRKDLTNYRPESVWDFMSEVEKAFDGFFDTSPSRLNSASSLARTTARFQPAVDIQETDECFLLSMDLPGMTQKDIKIDSHNGRLTVSGERFQESTQDDKSFHRIERSYGQFSRTFQLPDQVREENIQARFDNGVLEVMIPKAEVAKPRSIQIEAEKGGLFSKLLGKTASADKTEKKESH